MLDPVFREWENVFPTPRKPARAQSDQLSERMLGAKKGAEKPLSAAKKVEGGSIQQTPAEKKKLAIQAKIERLDIKIPRSTYQYRSSRRGPQTFSRS